MFRYLITYIGSLKGLLSTAKKILLVVSVFTIIIVVFYHTISGNRIKIPQDSYKNTQTKIYSTIHDKKLLSTEAGRAQIHIYRGYMCLFFGETCTDHPIKNKNLVAGGLVGKMTNLLILPIANPPASGIAWVNTSLEKAGFVPQSYASEGIGFASIKGYMGIWKPLRDISYMILVLIMVTIGFMIMFRAKLGAQTALNIEGVLPRIIISMLLITFSFAIAGFLIDLMYVVIFMIINIIFNLNIGIYSTLKDGKVDFTALQEYQNNMINGHMGHLWPDRGYSFISLGYTFYEMIPQNIKNVVFFGLFLPWSAVFASVMTGLGTSLASVFSKIGIEAATFGANIGELTGFPAFMYKYATLKLIINYLPGLVFGLLIFLTVFMFIFKIFFILLTSYIKIILYIIFAPFILLFEAIPGSGTFGWWFKNLVGELIAFPTVIALQAVGGVLYSLNNSNATSTFPLPFLSGFEPEGFNSIIALGIVLLTPDFIKIMRKLVGASDMGLNFGIGTFFASGGAIVSGVTGIQGNLLNLRNLLIGHDPHAITSGLVGNRNAKGELSGIPKVIGDIFGKFLG